MNKGIEQILNPMYEIMKAIGIKKSKKIPRKVDQTKELRLLKMPVILSKAPSQEDNIHRPRYANPGS